MRNTYYTMQLVSSSRDDAPFRGDPFPIATMSPPIVSRQFFFTREENESSVESATSPVIKTEWDPETGMITLDTLNSIYKLFPLFFDVPVGLSSSEGSWERVLLCNGMEIPYESLSFATLIQIHRCVASEEIGPFLLSKDEIVREFAKGFEKN